MTLTELPEKEENTNPSDQTVVDIGQTLVAVLKQAISQDRVTLGVLECTKVLEMTPEQVMLCVLPKLINPDSIVNIQHRLIQAHCWENDVNLVTVDHVEKLVALMPSSVSNNFNRSWDYVCILIGFPIDMSDDDFQITKHSYLFKENVQKAIQLPK